MSQCIARALAFVLLSGCVSPALASDWQPLSENDDGSKYRIDRESIRTVGDVRVVWMLTNLGEPLANGTRSQKALLHLNCKTWEYGFRSGVSYSETSGSGEVLASFSTPVSELEFKPVTPDSVTEAVLKAVCPGSAVKP